MITHALSENFCYFTALNYAHDNHLGILTLKYHANDTRPKLCSQNQLEIAKTNDTMWNAAQTQLKLEGWFDDRLRYSR